MTYCNPRLKHVNKIRDLAAAMPYSSFTNKILDHCNLLLETKKKIKPTNEPQIPIDKIFLRNKHGGGIMLTDYIKCSKNPLQWVSEVVKGVFEVVDSRPQQITKQ